MEEQGVRDQESLSDSEPINEDLFIEREETSSASHEDSDDDDSAHSSDEECFRPDTPIEEIEKERNDKKIQIIQNESLQNEFSKTIPQTKSTTEKQSSQKKSVQPSTCCILI